MLYLLLDAFTDCFMGAFTDFWTLFTDFWTLSIDYILCRIIYISYLPSLSFPLFLLLELYIYPICLLFTYLCSFFSLFLTHLCGSISGNTSFRYLPDSSPMKHKIVFFFNDLDH